MNGDAPSHDASLPLPALEHIDRVCADFENAWRAGAPSALDDCLADAQGRERLELLSELLLLELHYRSRQVTRFPEDAELVAGVFQRLATQSSTYAQEARASKSGDAAPYAAARSTDHAMKGSTAGERESSEAPASAKDVPTASSGQRYRVVRPHAKGGLGEVFLAYDRELNREVALKEIQEQHAGRASSRDRFKIEAEVTGGLEHPGIVPVYSLGARDDGRPFYAMRFVRGESLEEAVRRFHDSKTDLRPAERTLEFRRLLGRFLDVCQAIEYAHSRGVLHRDLKPANIMLGKYGETLVVDWGLAKVMGDDADKGHAEEEPTLLFRRAGAGATAPGAIGTPAYMSPEQARGFPAAVGPNSDIYALGAVLYTVLTGRAPVTGETTAEVLGKVLAGELDAPRRVVPSTPRPLEAICRKAMALEPDLRYASASDLANDIEAWLSDERVSAYREPLTTRGRRWIRRHQPSVAAATAAAFVAIISLSVGVVMLAAKGRELQIAQSQEAAAKDQAQERFHLALEAVEGYYDEVSDEVLLQQAELADLRIRLLKMPLGFYERLRTDLENDSSIESRAGLSDACHAIARILGDSGALDEAFDAIQKAIDIRQTLADEQPENADYRWGLVASWASFASFQSCSGNPLQALSTNQRTLRLSERLASQSPHDHGLRGWSANLHNNVGLIQADMDAWDDAKASFESAIEIRERILAQTPTGTEHRRHLAGHHHNLSSVYGAQGDLQPAVQHSLTAVTIQEELYEQNPDSTNGRSDLAMGYYNLANHCRDLGERKQAVEFFQKSIEIREGLLEEFPNVAAWRSDLAKSLNNCAEVVRGQGDYRGAIAYSEKAITIHERLATSYPEVVEHQFNLAKHYQNAGTSYDNLRDPQAALKSFQKAIQIHERLVAESPDMSEYRFALSGAQRSLGRVYRRMGDNEHAIEAFEQAIATCTQLVRESPDAAPYRGQMSLLWNSLGIAQGASGQVENAGASYQKAIELGKQLVAESPEITPYAMRLGGAYCNLAQLEQVCDVTAAIPWYSEAIRTLEGALKRDNTDRQTRMFLLSALVGRAAAYSSLDRHREAIFDWDRVIELDARNDAGPRLERARAKALVGDHQEATAEVRQLVQRKEVSDSTRYGSARVFSCAASAVLEDQDLSDSERKRLSDEYAGQAIEEFRVLQQAGYFALVRRVEQLEQDSLLDPIRTHEAFQEMLRTLRKESQ